MLTVTISHHLYLTREQRYQLINGEDVTVTGVSTPVWFFHGNTSEPAEEVFCEYILTNRNDLDYKSIQFRNCGYKINMPQYPDGWKEPKRPSNEQWRQWTKKKQELWYERNQIPDTANNLRDLKDGGSAYLKFREYNKVKRHGKMVNIVHFVEITTIESLENSLITAGSPEETSPSSC